MLILAECEAEGCSEYALRITTMLDLIGSADSHVTPFLHSVDVYVTGACQGSRAFGDYRIWRKLGNGS